MFVPAVNKWGTKLMPRPKWSDAKGKIKQPKELFEPAPPGWEWDGDWVIRPELSVEFEPDAMLNEFTDEIYEHQSRKPMSGWSEDSNQSDTTWCDLVRESSLLPKLCLLVLH